MLNRYTPNTKDYKFEDLKSTNAAYYFMIEQKCK